MQGIKTFGKWICCSLLSIFLIAPVFANNTDNQLQTATQGLLQFVHEAKTVNKTERNIQQLINLAKTRQQLLISKLKSHQKTADISRFLLPHKIISQLPREVQPFLEKEMSLKGALEIRIADDFKHNKSDTQYWLAADGKYYQLNFIDKVPQDLHSGDKVEIQNAYTLSGEVILSSAQFKVTKANLAIPTAFGPQTVVVMAVNFQDRPSNMPWALDTIKNAVINNVSNQYFESSYNQTTVVGDVFGWFTIAMNSTDACDTTKMANLAQQAATNAGVNLSLYKRRVIVYPKMDSCSFAGLGTVGIQGGYSQSWLNGTITLRVSAHELGHNLGLWHARYLKCTGSVEDGTCSLSEYGDNVDVMGGAQSAHFNAFQKDRLGWLNYQASPPITTVTTSGNYTIDAFETKNNNAKALKILKQTLPNGSSDYYYLELRRGIGFDSELATCGTGCDYTQGVVVHRGNSVAGNSSDVLDMTPDNNTSKIALLPGKSYSNPNAPNGGVTFTLNSIADNTANVSVKFGDAPPPPPEKCERYAHTLTISPVTTQWVNAGASATYTVTVKNNDNAQCTASNFYLTTSVPNDALKATLGTQWMSLAPGSSKTVSVTVASSAGMTTGIYSTGITASNTTTPGVHGTVIANLGINP